MLVKKRFYQKAWSTIWNWNYGFTSFSKGRTHSVRIRQSDYFEGNLYVQTHKGERLIRLYR